MKKPRIFYGYWILAACFFITACGVGCSYLSFSFFVTPLQAAMGWSRGEIMAAFTIFLMCMGTSGTLAGRMVDRYGARKVIPVGAFVITIGLAVLSRMDSLWQYYIIYAVIGISSAAIGIVTLSCVVSHWFSKRRGMAIGIMSMGVGASGVIFAPLIAVILLPNLGWSHTYLALAAIFGAVAIPLSLFVIKNKPADLGLFPDGMEAHDTVSIAAASAAAAEGSSLKTALATPAFWLIASSVILTHAHAGISQSVVPHLGDLGFPAGIAASTISITSITSTSSMFFFGWLCDRIPVKFACVIGLGAMALGILILINVEPESPVWMVWLYAVIFGFGMGSWMPTMSMLTSTSFGLASYGAIFGMMTLFQNLGGAGGPLLAGYLFDVMNTYHWAFIIILGLVLLAVPLVMLVRRPTPRPKTVLLK
ncbi:MAG: hypothetical protein A2144_04785 [Chloroflexi bacterium RBG_16_50_9]|nr:MAG: hypothetical protein A2144_04785 [Chloroflexi bacterium RBG_16_50_9]